MEQNLISPSIKLKAYSISELSEIYGCSSKTMRKWIRSVRPRVGVRVGHYYNPKQVKDIFESLGVPCTFQFL